MNKKPQTKYSKLSNCYYLDFVYEEHDSGSTGFRRTTADDKWLSCFTPRILAHDVFEHFFEGIIEGTEYGTIAGELAATGVALWLLDFDEYVYHKANNLTGRDSYLKPIHWSQTIKDCLDEVEEGQIQTYPKVVPNRFCKLYPGELDKITDMVRECNLLGEQEEREIVEWVAYGYSLGKKIYPPRTTTHRALKVALDNLLYVFNFAKYLYESLGAHRTELVIKLSNYAQDGKFNMAMCCTFPEGSEEFLYDSFPPDTLMQRTTLSGELQFLTKRYMGRKRICY